MAYPDRVAQRRLEREGRYLLAQGSGVALPPGDPLASHPYLVAAGLDAAGRDGRIPLPPPPAAAFTNTGKPISRAAALISASVWPGVVPGTTGTPAAITVARAMSLSPMMPMARAGGPTKTMPASAQALSLIHI